MQAFREPDWVSPTQYLKDEVHREVKHEYIGGVVHAMSGARNRHNLIAGEIFAALRNQLRGRRCLATNSDTKVRIRYADHTRFYYPDAMVVCEPNSENDSFQDRPEVIVEVLSDATRRVDTGEKKESYLSIPSLKAYLLVEQTRPRLLVYRRTEEGFAVEVCEGLDASVDLSEVGCRIALNEIYERVRFDRDAEDGEQ